MAKTAAPIPAPAVPTHGHGPNWPPAILWVLLLATALIYSKACYNGFTFLDDDYYILNNKYLRDFSWKGVTAIFSSFYSYNYHPLTTLTNLVEYRLFGLDPLPYHVVNVVLHLGNTCLVYAMAKKLSGRQNTGIITAALFALHPMHVESVAWVAERKDVLYAFFYLSAIVAYLHFSDGKRSAVGYVAVMVLYVAALLSKSAAITLPVVLLAIDLYRDRHMSRRQIIEKIPLLLLSVGFGIIALLSQRAGGAITELTQAFGPVNRIVLFTTGLSAYIVKLFLPLHLSAIHYYPTLPGNTLPFYYYLSLPFLAILGWLSAMVFRQSKEYGRDLLFGLSFFLIAISVMLQLVSVGSAIIAERYTYLSYIGLFYIVAQWVAHLLHTPKSTTAAAGCVAVLVVFAAQTSARIGVWQNTDTLFQDIIDKNSGNKNNGFVYNAWGNYYGYIHNPAAAARMYTQAILLKPTLSKAYCSRGLIYSETGTPQAALADFDTAIALLPTNARAYNGRGWMKFKTGNNAAAISDFNTALTLSRDYDEAYNNRGWVRYQSGDTAAALSDFNSAIAANGIFAMAYYNRASVYVEKGNYKAALADYDYMIKLYPKDYIPYLNRGIVRLKTDAPGACDDWNKAMEYGSKDAYGLIREYCH